MKDTRMRTDGIKDKSRIVGKGNKWRPDVLSAGVEEVTYFLIWKGRKA